MKNKTYYIVLLVGLLLTGCYRDDLCFLHPDGARVQLEIDWGHAQLQPNSATAVIFKDGTYFRTEIISAHPPLKKVINLPLGSYNIVVFDEQTSDYEKSIAFAGINRWETFAAMSVNDYIANGFDNLATRALKSSVDTLAVDRIINFEITHEMLNHTHIKPTPLDSASSFTAIDTTIRFIPKRIFTLVRTKINVTNGAGYYFTQRSPATLNGTSDGYLLGVDTYSEQPASFTLKPIQLPANSSAKDVIFASTIQIVGLPDFLNPHSIANTKPYSLTLPFTYSGGIDLRDINLNTESKRFAFTHRDDHLLPYHLLEIEVDIELPELVMVGGMDVGLDDWTDVDIPLDGPQRLYFYSNNGNKEMFWWQSLPGTTVNLPQPLFSPVEGLAFVGWNTEVDGSGTTYIAGDQFTMKKGSFLFHAMWEQIDLPMQTITFYENNGTPEEHFSSMQKPGALVPMPAPPFSAQGSKRFDHWNTERNGSGTVYYIGDKYRIPTRDINIYAIWK